MLIGQAWDGYPQLRVGGGMDEPLSNCLDRVRNPEVPKGKAQGCCPRKGLDLTEVRALSPRVDTPGVKSLPPTLALGDQLDFASTPWLGDLP